MNDVLLQQLRECSSDSLAQRAADEIERLQQWVHDCQAGMYINCVYCGHRYGPNDKVPATMADVLKEHIEQCPQHPMSALKKEVERLRANEGTCQKASFRSFCGIPINGSL